MKGKELLDKHCENQNYRGVHTPLSWEKLKNLKKKLEKANFHYNKGEQEMRWGNEHVVH